MFGVLLTRHHAGRSSCFLSLCIPVWCQWTDGPYPECQSALELLEVRYVKSLNCD